MKILVKYPTRSRPHKFLKNLDEYIKTSTSNLTFIISMDSDDITMNNPEMINKIESKKSERINILYFFGYPNGKINAINRDIPSEGWDILVATADDMIPYQDWDKVVIADFSDNDLFKAINYNTDPRLGVPENLITLPVMGKKLYDYFGYIYHKDYRSEFCDGEQTLVFKRLGVLTYKNQRPILHDWFGNQDALMGKNIREGNMDRAVYDRREKEGFPK